MANTIVVKGNGIRKERVAEGAISPGHLIKINADDTVSVHATAGGVAQSAVAEENEVFGKGIDVAYADGDNVLYKVLERGAEYYAIVAAGAAAIVRGAHLASAGDGTLAPIGVDQAAVAVALESIDNSGGGSAVFVKVEVL